MGDTTKKWQVVLTPALTGRRVVSSDLLDRCLFAIEINKSSLSSSSAFGALVSRHSYTYVTTWCDIVRATLRSARKPTSSFPTQYPSFAHDFAPTLSPFF